MNDTNNKIKNIYLIILTVLTVFCVLFGLLYHVSHWFSEYIFDDFFHFSNEENTTVDEELPEFDKIVIEAKFGDLEISYGDGYAVQMEYPSKYMPDCSVEDNTLHITQSPSLKLSWNNHWSSDITLVIPRGVTLQSADIKMDLGNIELNEIAVETLSISADMGNVELDDCTIQTCTIEADMGNVELSDCTVENGTYDADMGNIELEGNFVQITAECNMGAITVECPETKDTRFHLECDMGDIEVNGTSHGSKYIR